MYGCYDGFILLRDSVMSLRSFSTKYPSVWLFLSIAIISFPQWLQNIWGLFSSEPALPAILAYFTSHETKMPFSPYWITVPLGLAMFLWLVIELRLQRSTTFKNFPKANWYSPSFSVGKFADPELVRIHDEKSENRRKSINVEAILRRQLSQAIEKNPNRKIPSSISVSPKAAQHEEECREKYQTHKDSEARIEVEYMAAVQEVENNIYDQLRKGMLIARGFLQPVSANPQQILIPNEQWSILEMDFDKATASGHGITYVGVEIGKRT